MKEIYIKAENDFIDKIVEMIKEDNFNKVDIADLSPELIEEEE